MHTSANTSLQRQLGIPLDAADAPINGTDGDDVLTGTSGNDTIYGNDGADIIYGGAGDDRLYGDDTLDNRVCADALYGEDGNDFLFGGKGDDLLVGGSGNDSYVISLYAGKDVIDNYDPTPGRIDSINFTKLKIFDIEYDSRSGDDLTIHFRKQPGTFIEVTIKNLFTDAAHEINLLRFEDPAAPIENAVFTLDQFMATVPVRLTEAGLVTTFGERKENVQGTTGDDVIYLQGGNDVGAGNAGNDKLYGGAGNDSLSGAAGDDLLDGGIGNDSMNGGAGNDTFLLRLGSGQDSIDGMDNSAGRVDTIVFEDVASTGISFVNRIGADLILGYGSGDSLTLKAYFSSPLYEFSLVNFSDGVSWTPAQLLANYAVKLSANADTMTFSNNGETIFTGAGNDIIDAAGGNDVVYGELGTDKLSGGTGNDQLFGGDGNDTLLCGAGNDIASGDAGDDIIGGDVGNDILLGGAGKDQLNGADGDDILDGGEGNDYLVGGIGNDVYVLRIGSGVDIIANQDSTLGHLDTIRFEDIASIGLSKVLRVGGNLVLGYGNGDQVTINNHFQTNPANNSISQIQFTDQTLTVAQLQAMYGGAKMTPAAAIDDLASLSDFDGGLQGDVVLVGSQALLAA